MARVLTCSHVIVLNIATKILCHSELNAKNVLCLSYLDTVSACNLVTALVCTLPSLLSQMVRHLSLFGIN